MLWLRRALAFALLVLLLVCPSWVLGAQRHWVGGTASWNGTAASKWALTNGGAGGEAEPTSSDDCFLDSGSGTVTVTVATTTAQCLSLSLSGFTGTLAGATGIDVYGSLTLGGTWTNTGTVTFKATSGTNTITSNAKTITSPMTLDGVGGTWNLADAFSSTKAVTLTNGTFDANGQSFTALTFTSSNSNVRTITMGSGTWTITGNAAIVWGTSTATNLTFNGDGRTVRLTYSGATSTRTVQAPATTPAGTGVPSYALTAGTDTYAGTGMMDDLDFTGFGGAYSTTAATTIKGNLTLSATMTAPVTGIITFSATSAKAINSNGVATAAGLTFNGTGGTWTLSNNLATTGACVLTAGTIDINGRTFKCATGTGLTITDSRLSGGAPLIGPGGLIGN